MIGVLLGIVAIAALALGIFSYWEHLVISQHSQPVKNTANISWLDFFAKGKDSGFKNSEIKLLFDLAKQSNMEHPAALFWSHVQMDGCIRHIVQQYRSAGTFFMDENKFFLEKLFNFRKKMEMEKPKWRRGISKTTEISEMQIFQAVAGQHGMFKTKLIKNTPAEMIVERPNSSSLPVRLSWIGLRLQIYFWRQDDAAYFFETVVTEENFSGNIPVLKLLHTDTLERTQSRKSIRASTNKNARIFMFDTDNTEEKSVSKGIKCRLKDLSEEGCAVLVGGRAEETFKLILQFSIDKMQINIVGVVTKIDYNEDDNTSILHIQSDVIPIDIRNIIHCVVFGIIDDDIEITVPENTAEETDTEAEDSPPALLE
ncbi:MAG: PilZ domain-containing protein [Spirochaetaceae bacterium]|jgi:c-di-GMP-binding flagellar brake protein YcgR|nr:PilZ domain-containing protein [Spirochaetaceae bacterium]